MSKNGKAEKKAPKVARAPKPKSRVYKESPAGHYADIVAVHLRAIDKVALKTSGWGNREMSDNLGSMSTAALRAIHLLNGMAAAGFVPDRKKGGGGFKVAPGARVYLRQPAIDLLVKDHPQIASVEVYVSHSLDANDKLLPLRAGGSTPQHPWLGRISKRLLSASPV